MPELGEEECEAVHCLTRLEVGHVGVYMERGFGGGGGVGLEVGLRGVWRGLVGGWGAVLFLV